MPADPEAIWWVFILGVLASLLLLVAVVGSLVLSQRRYLKLHRSHARRVLEAQEEERAWVAREVHDDAIQRLMLVGRSCGQASRELAESAPEQASQLAGIQGEVEDLSLFLRGLAQRLHPALIDRGGLRAALTGLREELERGFGIRVELSLPSPDTPLPVSAQRALVLYRIAQEALHNVAKHAGVASARLELVSDERGIALTISDSGRGFEVRGRTRGPTSQGGIGLINMTERAYLAEGRLTISSRPGKGTTVSAWFPRDQGNGA